MRVNLVIALFIGAQAIKINE
jgi:hypothetical protein